MFKTILLTSVSLVFATNLDAQVIPKGYDKVEGDYYGRTPGCYANGRFSLCEGDLIGGASVIGRVSWRRDNTINNTSFTNAGRSWTRVTIDVSDVDMTKINLTFNQNPLKTPTRVFDAKFSLPTFTSNPTSKPAPFLNTQLSFGFSKVYVSTGKNGVFIDWIYRGGKLANGVAFGSSFRNYYVDGTRAIPDTSAASSTVSYIPAITTGGCNDSAITTTRPAYTVAGATLYGKKYSNATLAGKTRFYVYSYQTAPSAAVLHALAPFGLKAGVNIGAVCQKLYVNFSGTYVLRSQTTTTSGYSGNLSQNITTIPALSGLEIYAQSAWTDSKTKRFSLTHAAAYTIPQVPGSAKTQNRAILHRNNLTTTTGFWIGWHATYPWAVPMVKYAIK